MQHKHSGPPEINHHSYSHLIFDKQGTLKKIQPFQQMVSGKPVIYMQKTETRPLFLILYKNQLQMDQRS
jgi:hypothetical protein